MTELRRNYARVLHAAGRVQEAAAQEAAAQEAAAEKEL
jgi:hypothetical protein